MGRRDGGGAQMEELNCCATRDAWLCKRDCRDCRDHVHLCGRLSERRWRRWSERRARFEVRARLADSTPLPALTLRASARLSARFVFAPAVCAQ